MRWLFWLEKFVLVALAFAAAFYFVVLFKAWAQEKQGYFLFVGDLESAALVIMIGVGATFLIEKLLKWEVRALFHNRGPRR